VSKPPRSEPTGGPIEVENLDRAKFECVFPTCGGVCCQNGRPGLEPAEHRRIAANLKKFLPRLRPSARKLIEQRGFLTRRIKEGCRTLAVSEAWCVFHNEGCVLHQVGAEEGDRWKYKPWRCIVFPLTRDPKTARWHVRQWKEKGEAWDLFCLDPKESPKQASATLAAELEFARERLPGSVQRS
jgi:uncharacterized protein DUF3109